MPLTITLTGTRHTDGTEGRVSLTPRVPWYVVSGANTLAPGPMFFKITTSGTLSTLADTDATVVPSYDSLDNMTFTPSGAAYLARINISGHEILETWTIDGAYPTSDWGTLGIKPTPSDRVTYPLPLTVDSPVRHYTNSGSLPVGDYSGQIVYVEDIESWFGYSVSAGWHVISS